MTKPQDLPKPRSQPSQYENRGFTIPPEFWIAFGVVVVLLFIFSLGVTVGRMTSPVDCDVAPQVAR